jgi:hypothetical protein
MASKEEDKSRVQQSELERFMKQQVDLQYIIDMEKIKFRNKFRHCDEAFRNGPEQIDVKVQRYTSCILDLDPQDVPSREGWWNFISPDAANIGVSIARGLNVGNALS